MLHLCDTFYKQTKNIHMETTLNHLHHQDADWQRALDFYAEEINLLLPPVVSGTIAPPSTGTDVAV
jgi:hypothetical protein